MLHEDDSLDASKISSYFASNCLASSDNEEPVCILSKHDKRSLGKNNYHKFKNQWKNYGVVHHIFTSRRDIKLSIIDCKTSFRYLLIIYIFQEMIRQLNRILMYPISSSNISTREGVTKHTMSSDL